MKKYGGIFLSFILLCFGSCKEEKQKEEIKITANMEVLRNAEECVFIATINAEVEEMVFYFDGEEVERLVTSPYQWRFTPDNLIPGTYTVRCTARSAKNDFYEGQLEIPLKVVLGESLQGGKVFYLSEDGRHGLIASESDIEHELTNGQTVSFFTWGPTNKELGTDLDDGAKNTPLLAEVSLNYKNAGFYFKGGYEHEGYSDWYIPSINELDILQKNKHHVGDFPTTHDLSAIYWSSSEYSAEKAFRLNMVTAQLKRIEKNLSHKIRPIRRF